MSEQQRTNFYNLLREQTDEETAEFVMSCLAPAPLSDLVTKEHFETVLSAEFSKFALTMAEQRAADRSEQAAQRESDRKDWGAQLDALRTEVKHQFRWLVGIGVAILGVVVAFGTLA